MDEALANLQELPLPEPVSYAPQTAGWYLLLAIALMLAAVVVFRWRRHRASNRYRREALSALVRIERESSGAGALDQLPALVKQTLLAFAPREDVAQLSGNRLLQFLDSTYGGTEFTAGPGRLLPKCSYGSPDALAAIPPDEAAELLALLRRWIKRHHARL